MDDSSDRERRVLVNTELMNLSEDFVAASRAVGKIIISEVYLPFEDKVFFLLLNFVGAKEGKGKGKG